MNDQSLYPAPVPRPRAFCAAWAWHCLRLARKHRHRQDSAASFRMMAREWIEEGKSGRLARRSSVDG